MSKNSTFLHLKSPLVKVVPVTRILLMALPMLVAGCSTGARTDKPWTLDELRVEVSDRSREVGYTNKEAGFLYTETSAEHRSSWQGWHIMATKVMDDYVISTGGRKLRKSDVRLAQVTPLQLTRVYPSGIAETVTLLDSLNAIAVELDHVGDQYLSAAPQFRFSKDPADYKTSFQDGTLLISIREQSRQAQGNEAPRWIGVVISEDGRSNAAPDSGSLDGALFAPAVLRSRVSSHHATVLFVAGNSEAEASQLAACVRERYRTLIEQRRARMEQVLNSSFIRTDHDRLDRALQWAKLSMDALIMHQRGTGIFAGLPWFDNYWGRDSFIALPGATLVTGRFDQAKEILRSFAAWQNTDLRDSNFGRIPNLVTPTSIAYNTADGTPWFVLALNDYLNYSGDTSIVREMYPVVRRTIEGTLRFHADNRYFLTHGDAETWMDAVGPEGPWTPRGNRANDVQALWYKQLRIAAAMAHWSNDRASEEHWSSVASTLLQNFQTSFVDSQTQLLYDHLRADGTPDRQLRPNQLFAWDILREANVRDRIFSTVTEKLVYRHGLASLSQDDEAFHPYHHVEPIYVQDAAYHQGIVWTWLAGRWIQLCASVGLPDLAFQVTDEEVHQILERGAVGTLSELLDAAPRPGESEPRLSGTFSQAWSLAEFIRNVYQSYLGASSDAANRQLFLYPRLPREIRRADFIVNVGHDRVRVQYDVGDRSADVRVQSLDPSLPLRVTLGWPFDDERGRTSAFTLLASRSVRVTMTPDTCLSMPPPDSIALSSSRQRLRSFPNGAALKLATPFVRPGLKALHPPNQHLLKNGDIKVQNPTARIVYDASDPEGDDNGSGAYTYPATPMLKPGSLDIRRFTVAADDARTYFTLRFRNLSDPGWHPEYGFQLTFAAIAVDKDGRVGTGTSTIGRNANFTLPDGAGYELVIFVGGGLRVEDGSKKLLAEYVPVQGDEQNPLGSVPDRTIYFSIPNEIIGTPGPSWKFYVLVGAQDDHGGSGIGDFRNVEATASEWAGGGKRRPSDPNVYDVMLPQK